MTFLSRTALFLVVSFLNIHIRSEGCDDPGMTNGTCGIAYIRVNGKDHSPHGRGHNVVIVDAKTGKALLLIACKSEKKIVSKTFFPCLSGASVLSLYRIWY